MISKKRTSLYVSLLLLSTLCRSTERNEAYCRTFYQTVSRGALSRVDSSLTRGRSLTEKFGEKTLFEYLQAISFINQQCKPYSKKPVRYIDIENCKDEYERMNQSLAQANTLTYEEIDSYVRELQAEYERKRKKAEAEDVAANLRQEVMSDLLGCEVIS